jgi:hypothetical protein
MFTRNTRPRTGWAALALGASALLAVGATTFGNAATADAASPTTTVRAHLSTTSDIPSNLRADSGEPVTQLFQDVRNGTLLKTHGTHTVCAYCDAEVVTVKPGSTKALTSTVPAGYGPADLATAYDLPKTSTSKATIAIIDAGVDANLASDLATYRSTYGLPACTVASGCLTLENYTGGAQPAPQTGALGEETEENVAVETSLDVDLASAACPTCHILELSVPWQAAEDDNDASTHDFATAVNTAVAAGASAVSISYGFTVDATNTQGFWLNSLNHPGVAITASTGDSGFTGGIHANWPSALPSVTAAGATSLTATGTESAWSESGSGCEIDFTSADGQSLAATDACGGHRAVADVSSDGDPNTGLAVYDTYAPFDGWVPNWMIVGGTSAAAPYISGLYARAGHLSRVDGPNTLYRAPAADFNDVTSGNNEGYNECAAFPDSSPAVCNAGPGWDGPSGLGSPHGLAAF